MITVETNDLVGWDYELTDGETANITGLFTALPENVGLNEINITATDDGAPTGITELTVVIEVLNIELPDLVLEGNTAICGGRRSGNHSCWCF